MNYTAVLDSSEWCESPTSRDGSSRHDANEAEDVLRDWYGGSWWNGLRDAAGGVVRLVQGSAQSLAQEMASLEWTPEDDAADTEPLPWEIWEPSTGRYRADPVLKEKILQLSQDARIFTEPTAEDNDAAEDVPWSDARVAWIHRLRDLDPQLRQYSGSEGAFWGRYVRACEAVRAAYLSEEEERDSVPTTDVREEAPTLVRSLSSQQLPSSSSSSSVWSNNSFVPCSEEEDHRSSLPYEDDDESSFVCLSAAGVPSAPHSCWSMASVDSMVLVEVPRSRDDAGGV